MAVEQDRVLLTERQVAEWRKEQHKLEIAISSTRQRLAEINKMLEAVAVLSGGEPALPNSAEPTQSEITDLSESMTHAVERIVRQALVPLTKAQLKKQLAEEGLSGERLGNYFYTVIARLKNRERIQVHSDGRVSAGAKASADSNGNAG